MAQDDRSQADDLGAWVGREAHASDRIDARIARALAATLDRDATPYRAGAALPPLWHWVYFTPHARAGEIGADGHPLRGGFLPPVALPNRMWAGGRLRFLQPLHIDEDAQRDSRILRCERKRGRAGDLVFVSVEHRIATARGVALVEEHDIVYRNAAPRGAPLAGEAANADAQWRRTIRPDPVLLFRYSALTFNGHRIHYDAPYATQVEGYPGLVVHGPLTATLLLEAFGAAHPRARVTRFAFRAVGPLFDSDAFDVCGRVSGPGAAELWAHCNGRVAMRADLAFE